MILCIGTTPAAQRVMVFKQLSLNTVNRASRTLEGWGGKAVNVAKVLSALGEEACLLGFQGGGRGAQLARYLEGRGVRCANVEVKPETRLCTTLVDESSGEVTELVEESQPVEAADYRGLLELIRTHAAKASAMVMSGTVAPGGPLDFYGSCIQTAREANPKMLTVVDAQGISLQTSLPFNPNVVKPNRSELERTIGRNIKDDKSMWDAMRDLLAHGAGCVVVTSGPREVFALSALGAWRVTPPDVRVLNPIGSGDAFTAALTASLQNGDDPGEACRKGAAAGAANALSLMSGELELSQFRGLIEKVQVESVKL